jgi:ABC-type dipeptide/oligopeptide/nickel transport system permease subunit
MSIVVLLHLAPAATSLGFHNASAGSHIVNKIIMQIMDTTAAVPTITHSIALCIGLGFKIRVNMDVTAILGRVKERIPNKKLTVLSRMAFSKLSIVKYLACFPKPTPAPTVEIAQYASPNI